MHFSLLMKFFLVDTCQMPRKTSFCNLMCIGILMFYDWKRHKRPYNIYFCPFYDNSSTYSVPQIDMGELEVI